MNDEEKNKIPEFFKNLYPALTFTEFNNLLDDPSFLNKEFFLCEDCFLETTKFLKLYGGLNNAFQTKFGVLSEAMKKDPNLKMIYVI